MPDERLAAGDLILVDGRASVQFAGRRRIIMRILSVSTKPTYHGWAWITGYVLDQRGDAVERREIFVQPSRVGRQRQAVRQRRPARQPAGV